MLIRRALTELMRSKPIQSITVKELCAAAGIHRGTFYAHYEDLYDLLRQMEEEMLSDFEAALAPMLSEEGGTLTLKRLAAGIFQCLRDNADLCTVTLGDYGDKAFERRLIQLGRKRCIDIYSRLFPHASIEQIVCYYTFVSAGCIGLLEQWLGEGALPPTEEAVRIAEGIMTRGIGFLEPEDPPKGS